MTTAKQPEIIEFEYAPAAPLAVYETPIVMVGGGDVDRGRLGKFGKDYPVIAVDSGADAASELGLNVEMLIGDLDSVTSSSRNRVHRQIRIREQYSTDFQKALKVISAPKIFGFGFLGKRFDHELGALHALAENVENHGNKREIVLVDRHDLVVMRKRCFQMALPQGIRLSLWSMLPQRFTRTKGLFWPLNELEVGTGFNLAVCNQVMTTSSGKNGETEGNIAEGKVSVEIHADHDAPFAVLMDPEVLGCFID